jgi:hypothetical protein
MPSASSRDVTLVLTSCGRFDLLARTLSSLYTHVPADAFAEVIIAEDWDREGQVRNIDRAYARVKTPYIFHAECDWEFYRSGFVEQSLDILEQNPTILQVWLRAHNDTNGHPLLYENSIGYRTSPILDPLWSAGWGGFSWNPGLRRKLDWEQIGGYMRHWQGSDNRTEAHLSQFYSNRGRVAAIIPEPSGYVRHIGEGRSTQR